MDPIKAADVAGGTVDTKPSDVISRDEFNKVVSQRDEFKKLVKDNAKALEELTAFKAKIETEKLSEAEKTAKRIADLEQLANKAGEYEKAINTTLETKMAAIPEDRRTLIPESLTPAQKLEYIAKNEGFLVGTRQGSAAPQFQGGTGAPATIPASERPKATDLEVARKMGIPPEKAAEYAARYRKQGAFAALRNNMTMDPSKIDGDRKAN